LNLAKFEHGHRAFSQSQVVLSSWWLDVYSDILVELLDILYQYLSPFVMIDFIVQSEALSVHCHVVESFKGPLQSFLIEKLEEVDDSLVIYCERHNFFLFKIP
jgi:hypothetical protein